ncbi:MAG: glycosyltransferase family 4 protein [Deltaproteobacteria bacterium]|nr:glycosyltransferase family 4 protein [Deltaproteobacteria bacterium]
MGRNNPKRTIRFVNTFKPVVPLYEAVFPGLVENGWHPTTLLSRGVYRSQHENDKLAGYKELVWVPSRLQSRKRWCAIFFWLLAPFHLLFVPKTIHVFLTQPPLFFILGAVISKLRGVKYIIHIMDVHPELLAISGIINVRGYTYRLLSRCALNALRHADGIIAIGRCMKDRLTEKGIQESKIRLVSNWASNRIYPLPEKDNVFRCQHNLEEKFLVMYSGNMGVPHHFSTILHVAERLEDIHDIIFVFIGRGGRRKEIEQAIAGGNKNLLLLDFQPMIILSHSLSAANIHFFSLRPGFEGHVVPSKFYGMLASGRPVIYEGTTSGEVAQVIHETQVGKVVEPGNKRQLYESIMYYYNTPSAIESDGQKSYQIHLERFQESVASKTYVHSLLELITANEKAL